MNRPRFAWTRSRLTTVVAAAMASVIFLVIAGITVLEIFRQQAFFEQQLQEKGLVLSRTLNDVLANPLYFRDMERLRHLADAAKAQPEIQALTVFAPDGRILISPGSEKFATGSIDAETLRLAFQPGDAGIRYHEDHVELLSAVVVGDEIIGGIKFQFDSSVLSSQIRQMLRERAWQSAILLIMGIALSVAFAQSIVRPVQELTAVTDRIAAGDFDVSAEQDRDDEIGQLAQSVHAMAARLRDNERRKLEEQHARLRRANEVLQSEVAERKRAQQDSENSRNDLQQALEELRRAQEKMVQQERLSAVGQMSSGIAHDINNRLQVILGLTDRLMLDPSRREDDEETLAQLTLIRDSAKDAADVVGLLREFYRPQTRYENFEAVDIRAVVERSVQLTEPRWRDEASADGINIDVRADLADLPRIDGSPVELREALINLIFNAVDSLPDSGNIDVRSFVDGDAIVIEVSDDGTGMPEDVRARCLEPFFTTKGARGSGLGLAMVLRTARRHGGRVSIDSREGEGTTVRLILPIRQAPAVDTEPVAAEPTATPPLRVLVADDEPLVRKLLAAMLTDDGHQVTTAADGAESLSRFRAGDFDLVMIDRAMPGISGDELAVQIKTIANVPIIMVTGFGDMMIAAQDKPDGVDLTLGKPIRHDELRAAVAQVYRPPEAERMTGGK